MLAMYTESSGVALVSLHSDHGTDYDVKLLLTLEHHVVGGRVATHQIVYITVSRRCWPSSFASQVDSLLRVVEFEHCKISPCSLFLF